VAVEFENACKCLLVHRYRLQKAKREKRWSGRPIPSKFGGMVDVHFDRQ
jgi:hypothetical protein